MFLIDALLVPVLQYAYPAWCNVNVGDKKRIYNLYQRALCIAGSRNKGYTLEAKFIASLSSLYRVSRARSHPLHALFPATYPRAHNTRRSSSTLLKCRTESFRNHFVGKCLRLGY